MLRIAKQKEKQYTEPDHRPMVPEFCGPKDLLDAAVRDIRRRYGEINPTEHLKWR